MMFHEELKEMRMSRNYTFLKMAQKLGLNQATYKHVENGATSPNAKSSRKIMASEFLTSTERRRLLNSDSEGESKGEHGIKRIQDIPNFYEELHALGDLSELDMNDPDLQKLRVRIGGDRIYNKEHRNVR